MRLIGLNGRLHSGKDTAFEFITEAANEEREQRVTRAAFADRLKMSAAIALGFDPETVEEAVAICNEIKETGSIKTAYDKVMDSGNLTMATKRITGREYLQRYGTEAHREVFGTDFWVDALLPSGESNFYRERLRERFPETDVLVITDVRFENEAARILELGGEVWHIDADERLGPLPDDAHPSERPLKGYLLTYTVDNNVGLVEYRDAIRSAYLA